MINKNIRKYKKENFVVISLSLNTHYQNSTAPYMVPS